MPTYGSIKVNTLTFDVSGSATDLPISTIATDSDVALKADINSPTFTGSPTVPGYAALSGATFTGQINATDIVCSNNLTVNGTQTILNTETLQVEDKEIDLGKVSSPSNASASGGGIKLLGGSDGDKTITWLSSNNAWNFSEHIHLGDNKQLLFGASSDLKIYHDQSSGQSIIEESGPSVLKIKASDFRLSNTANSKDYIQANDGGAVKLFHNGGAAKLETTSSGINVTGQINVNGSALSAAPEIEATASGAIAANDPVIINLDGTVSKPAVLASAFGSEQEFTTNSAGYTDVCYEPINNKIVVAYSDQSDSHRPKAIAGTVDASNKTITWGSILVLATTTSYNSSRVRVIATNDTTLTDDGWCVAVWYSTYDSNCVKGAAFRTSSSDNNLTSNGDNTTYGKSLGLSNTWLNGAGCQLDIAWNTGSSGHAGGMILNTQTTSGYSVRADHLHLENDGTIDKSGSYANVGQGLNHKSGAIHFIPETNNYLCVLGQYDNDKVDARVVFTNPSNNNVEYNTDLTSVTADLGFDPWVQGVAYAAVHKKFLAMYTRNGGTKDICGLLLDTTGITTDGGATQTLSLGTTITVNNTIGDSGNFICGIGFDDDKQCWIMTSRGASSPSSNHGMYNIVKYDGTSLSLGTSGTFNAANVQGGGVTYDENSKTTVITYKDAGDGDDGTAIVMVPEYPTLKETNFIGFAQAGYSNGATAKISVVGNQSTHSSLTPGSAYYVQTNGTISTTPAYPSVEAGIAFSATKLLIKG